MKRICAAAFVLLLTSNIFAQPAPSQVTFSKVFTPSTIGPGSTSTVQFTITNQGASPVTGMAFSDALPTVPDNLLVATPALASTNCSFGVVDAAQGGSNITFFDGELGAGSTCTVSVNVTAGTPGVYTNPVTELTYNELTGPGPSSQEVNLVVDDMLPGFSKSFVPDIVPLGDRSTLTFTIDNTINPSNVANLDFTDILPAGILIANPANASTDCGTTVLPATLIATAGSNSVVLDSNGTPSFPALAAGSICTVSVDVVTSSAGVLSNITSDLQANFVSAGFAGNNLEVTVTPIAIQKSFVDDPVAAGGLVTLEFIINNFDRNLVATDVAFSDDLTTLNPDLSGLILDSVVSNDCGGAVAGATTSNIDFSGGSLAPASSCSIQVLLQIPAGPVTGNYVNTTSAVTATVDGIQLTGNQASDTLFISNAPVLSKEFLETGTLAPDPVANPGDDVVLRFTVTNASVTSSATDVTFIDELTDGSGGNPPDLSTGFLPFPVNVTLPPVPDPPCGAGSSLSLISVETERQGLMLADGTLGPGESCTFEVTIKIPDNMPGGTFLNTTEAPSATVDGITATGFSASDSLTINAAPSLTKEFKDDPVTPGDNVILEFTLSHPAEAGTDATAIAFTDDLSAVLTGLVASGLPLTQACDPDGPGGVAGTGTLSGSAGDTLLTFQNGVLAPGESCVFSVSLTVPAGAPFGDYLNTTSDVSAIVAGVAATSAPAGDTLQVASLVFSKEFIDNPVIAGGTSLLRFTIENIDATLDADITSFTDSLSGGLPGLAASGGVLVDTCGGTLTGTTFLTYSGGGVLAGSSCSIDVEVLVPLSTADNSYTNVTSNLSATQGSSVVINPAVDTLVVNSTLLQLNKTFSPNPVAPGDSVILEFTLANLDTVNAASNIGFTDDLGAALTGLTANSLLLDECGGSLSGIGTDMLTYSGGVLAAAATCIVRVSLDVPASAAEGTFTNTTSSVSGTITSLAVTGDPASDELEVFQQLQFNKSFAGPATAGGTAILTFTISNPRANAVNGLSFSDDLNAFIPGMVATSLPASPCGALSVLSGTSFITFKGGELLANGGMCSFDIGVLVPASATPGRYSNTTSGLFENGLKTADPATADLVIEPAPTFAKSFAPAVIDAGDSSILTFTIDNSGSALAANSLAFNDNLPTGVEIASPASASNTCSGTLSAVAGASVISLTGGSVAAGALCSLSVDITSSTAGEFVNTTGDLTSTSGNSGSASDTLTVGAVADVSISKTASTITASSGQSIAYTITAINSGPSEDPLVAVTDVLPAGLNCTYSSVAAGGATGNSATGSGNIADSLSMPAGSTVTYTADCSIATSVIGGLSNTAVIAGSVFDPSSDNNSSTSVVTVVAVTAIPTLSNRTLMLLMLLFAGLGAAHLRFNRGK